MKRGDTILNKIFAEEGIEYLSVVDYKECRSINPRLESKIPFTPSSVIVFVLPYYTGECENISRYAASLDYHIIIGEITGKIIEKLKKSYPVSNFVGVGDHSPIDERDCALKGGLGFIGDNGLIINEKYGSYVFLGDIICDLHPDELRKGVNHTLKNENTECCHCGACKKNCPTGILRGESSDCLSAITQRKGELSESDITLMKKYNTVWGCDVCQSCCPHNKNPKKTPIDIFYRERIQRLDMKILNSMTEDEFKRRAFSWRGRAVVERNLKLFDK